MMPGNDADTGRSNAQVQRLAASAAELGRSIRRVNALPPGFPDNELLALADALEDAPGADVEARLEAGLYVRERLVEVRRRFVSEAPDDPDIPSIDAIAHCLNDTIAELSTLVVLAGVEAEKRARPDRAIGTSIVATKTAGTDAVDLQRASDRTTADIQRLETTLRSAPVNIHIDQSRHYQFHLLNFANSIKQLKFSVKVIGAFFKGEFLDRAWLDKLFAALERARAKFLSAWEATRAFLGQIDSIVDAVQSVSRDVADLGGLVRQVIRRVFRGRPKPLRPGVIFRDIYELWCPELVVIPPGEFIMGSSEAERQWAVRHGASRDWAHVEKPQHRVKIEAPLAVSRYAVTFEEYDRFASASGREKPRDEGWGRGRRPVINVSWEDAKAYVAWLSNETGQPYRLLSEAEWEYAARAGTTTWHWWGDDITSENANFGENVRGTSEVGTYPMNPWALHEMSGNVWEWGEDCWNANYEGAPADGSAWTSGDCSLRTIRGGSWKSKRGILRAAYRNRHKSSDRKNNIGFRVARTFLGQPAVSSAKSTYWGDLEYHDPALIGRVTFDYANNNGRYSIGRNEFFFETMWSKADDRSIHIYNDPPSIAGVAEAPELQSYEDVGNLEYYDMSSRVRTIQEGEHAILKNRHNRYAVLKILDIKDRTRSDSVDELTFEFWILADTSRSA